MYSGGEVVQQVIVILLQTTASITVSLTSQQFPSETSIQNNILLIAHLHPPKMHNWHLQKLKYYWSPMAVAKVKIQPALCTVG